MADEKPQIGHAPKGLTVPVPKRDDFFGNLKKVAAPEKAESAPAPPAPPAPAPEKTESAPAPPAPPAPEPENGSTPDGPKQ
jgi:hypothetical protein